MHVVVSPYCRGPVISWRREPLWIAKRRNAHSACSAMWTLQSVPLHLSYIFLTRSRNKLLYAANLPLPTRTAVSQQLLETCCSFLLMLLMQSPPQGTQGWPSAVKSNPCQTLQNLVYSTSNTEIMLLTCSWTLVGYTYTGQVG